jgi:hypothetical protein
MFGMLHGGLPRITQDGVDLDALETAVKAGTASPEALHEATDRLVAEVVAAQVDAGLELVTDGQVRWPDLAAVVLGELGGAAGTSAPAPASHPAPAPAPASTPDPASTPAEAPAPASTPGAFLVDAWRAASALTDHPVAQAVPGPYSLGRRNTGASAARRRARTMALADALAVVLRSLADAGCPIVVVDEPAAVRIGTNTGERRLFADAHRRLLEGVPDLHAMLAISGGSAADAGPETIFAAPYRSHLFDLIAGPDDWNLVRAAPPDRGIVCAVLRAGPGPFDDQAPILVWAAQYAASTGSRGLARVGLANTTPLRGLSAADALTAARALGRAAALAAMTPEDAVAAGLDARTFANRPRPRRPARPTSPPPEG